MPAEDPAWYPDPESFAKVYCGAGFHELRAELIERPTPLPAGRRGLGAGPSAPGCSTA